MQKRQRGGDPKYSELKVIINRLGSNAEGNSKLTDENIVTSLQEIIAAAKAIDVKINDEDDIVSRLERESNRLQIITFETLLRGLTPDKLAALASYEKKTRYETTRLEADIAINVYKHMIEAHESSNNKILKEMIEGLYKYVRGLTNARTMDIDHVRKNLNSIKVRLSYLPSSFRARRNLLIDSIKDINLQRIIVGNSEAITFFNELLQSLNEFAATKLSNTPIATGIASSSASSSSAAAVRLPSSEECLGEFKPDYCGIQGGRKKKQATRKRHRSKRS
jgi:hypothetical protein